MIEKLLAFFAGNFELLANFKRIFLKHLDLLRVLWYSIRDCTTLSGRATLGFAPYLNESLIPKYRTGETT